MGESAKFTWDDNKDRENRRKHGLPLVAAEALLLDPLHLDSPTRWAAAGELRRILVDKQTEGCYLAFTHGASGRDTRCRFARPAGKERRAYQESNRELAVEGPHRDRTVAAP